MNPSSPIRVLIADDHPLVRAGVTATLSASDQYQVVGEARNSNETLEKVRSLRPHLLILDLEMEDHQPARLVEQCAQVHAPLKVLILSARCGPRDVEVAKNVHVHGFVVKQEAPDCLLQAVRVVLEGENWFSHQVLQSLKQVREATAESVWPTLTSREEQVLRGLLQAKDNQAIAASMAISKHTVRRYVTQIFQKLCVKNRMEAILWARRNGFPRQ